MELKTKLIMFLFNMLAHYRNGLNNLNLRNSGYSQCFPVRKERAVTGEKNKAYLKI